MPIYNNPTVDNNFGSDAEWRTWCQAIDAAMLASGFLVNKTDETGQIDLTSAARPAAGLYAGYKMYKANDSLQATKPIFVKLEFGVGSSGTNRGLLRVTVSTGTNGSGTQTLLISTNMTWMNMTADGSSGARIVGCGDDTSCHAFQHDGAISSAGAIFSIGRSVKRSDKSATGDFVWASTLNSVAGTMFGSTYYTDFTNAWTSLDMPTLLAGRPDGTPSTGGDINTVYLFDCVVYRAAQILTLPMVCGRASEVPYTDPVGSAFTISVWGSSRTFMPLPFGSFGASGTGKCCVPFEV